MIEQLYEILEMYDNKRMSIKTEDDFKKIAALIEAIFILENQAK